MELLDFTTDAEDTEVAQRKPNNLSIRASGCIVSNDMKVLIFLCATSVSSVSSVVRCIG